MKPTLSNIERRIDALETQQNQSDAPGPELSLVLNGEDGNPAEIHIFACNSKGVLDPKAGVFIVPAKMTMEQWGAMAEQERAKRKTERAPGT